MVTNKSFKLLDQIVERELSVCYANNCITLDGSTPSTLQQEQITNALQLWFSLLISIRKDICKIPTNEMTLERVGQIIQGILQEPVDIVEHIKKLNDFDAFIVSLPYPRTVTYDKFRFNRLLKSYGLFLYRSLSLISPLIMDNLGNHINNLVDLRSALGFLKKINIERDDLLFPAFSDLIDREEKLTYSPEIVEPLRIVIRRLLKGFRLEPLEPIQSTGSSAEFPSYCNLRKCAFLKNVPSYTIVRLQELGLVRPSDEALYGWQPYSGDGPVEYHDDILAKHSHPGYENPCVLKWVPKSYKGLRLIAKQSSGLLPLQLAVMTQLYAFFSTDQYLKSRIPIFDSTVSRQLCQQSSWESSHATVDLSAASDCISNDLIKAIMPEPLNEVLQLLRHKYWVIDNNDASRMDLHAKGLKDHGVFKMFAPMGSGTTFPILSLLSAALCELACDRTSCRHDYVVFGDDIIIPQPAFLELCDLLSQAGFTVNTEKSFSGDQLFRESCGLDAYAGVDVTPLRVSRTLGVVPKSVYAGSASQSLAKWKRQLTSSEYTSLMAYKPLYNGAVQHGYNWFRAYLLDRRIPPIFRFSDDMDKGLFSPYPTNYHLPAQRINGRWWFTELSISPYDTKYNPSLEEQRYLYWFYLAERREPIPESVDCIEDIEKLFPEPIVARPLKRCGDLTFSKFIG